MPIPIPEALAIALDPHRVNLHPALIHDAWATLKAARGQALARPELLRPAHLVHRVEDGAVPVCTAAELDAAVARATPKIRRQVARRGFPILAHGWLRGHVARNPEGAA